MCLRGSQKQSRAREQRWSHTHQHRITQPWWVDLGGRRLKRGSVHSPPLTQLWRPTKFFISCLRVSGSKLSELLLSCSRHRLHWENLGVPYLVKPENPLWKKRADPPPLPLRTTDVWVCMRSSVHTWCFVCLLFLCTWAAFCLWHKSCFYFFKGRCGCRSLLVLSEM